MARFGCLCQAQSAPESQDFGQGTDAPSPGCPESNQAGLVYDYTFTVGQGEVYGVFSEIRASELGFFGVQGGSC